MESQFPQILSYCYDSNGTKLAHGIMYTNCRIQPYTLYLKGLQEVKLEETL